MDTTSPLPTPTHCSCGHRHGDPELDVRAVPGVIRHQTVHLLFDSLAPGHAMVIAAPHDPQPLLAELRSSADIEVEYLEEGPQTWRLRITRR